MNRLACSIVFAFVLGAVLATALGAWLRTRAPRVSPARVAYESPPPTQEVGLAVPPTRSARWLPDPSLPRYSRALKNSSESLYSLYRFYDDQYEADRFAMDRATAIVEQETGVWITRGDVFGFELDSMNATLATFGVQSRSPANATIQSEIAALPDKVAAVQHSGEAARWMRIAAQSAEGDEMQESGPEARVAGAATADRTKSERRDPFDTPWTWPGSPPENWPSVALVYVTLSRYEQKELAWRSKTYQLYLQVQKQLEREFLLSVSELKARRISGAPELVAKLRDKQELLNAKLRAVSEITTNMRFYCVCEVLHP